MTVDKMLIIPESDKIDEYLELAGRYGLGFEYNDFFNPKLLEDNKGLKDRISEYKNRIGDNIKSTLHGAFYDIIVFSEDSKIREVSDFRVTQSINIARELSSEAVIFHTNYNPSLNFPWYRENWIEKNSEYWHKKCAENTDINIYMENMFDDDPVLLRKLSEKMSDMPNFGVCFDYAHAHVFGDYKKVDEWVDMLSPYVKHIHINDNDFTKDSHEALGKGRIDWEHFAKLYNTRMQTASVLLEVSGTDKIKESLSFVEKTL